MLKPLHVLTLAFVLLCVAGTGYAQDLVGATTALAVGGGVAVGSMRQSMTAENVAQKLQQMGYTNISDITPSLGGKTFQVNATSPIGTPVNITVEVITGAIIVETPR